MDKDRKVGSAKVVKRNAKVAVGKAIGDAKLEARSGGSSRKGGGGKIQNAAGGIKDTIRDASGTLSCEYAFS